MTTSLVIPHPIREKPYALPSWEKTLLDGPRALYAWHLGWLLGPHFLLLIHRGRVSGLPHQTLLHGIHYDHHTQACVVVAAFGPTADWVLNCEETPPLLVQIGRRAYRPIIHWLSEAEAYRELCRYLHRPSVVLWLRFLLVWRRYPPTTRGVAQLAHDLPLFRLAPCEHEQDEASCKTTPCAAY